MSLAAFLLDIESDRLAIGRLDAYPLGRQALPAFREVLEL